MPRRPARPEVHPAGRALIGLWAAIALLAGGGALLLWRLGPPSPARPLTAAVVPGRHPDAPAAAAVATTGPAATGTKAAGPAGAGTGAAGTQGAAQKVAQGGARNSAPGGLPGSAPDVSRSGIANSPGIAVSPPIPAMLEPAADFPDRTLPIVAPDGRIPAVVYAAHAGLPASGPQVAILLEGLGLSDSLDQTAVDTLPAQVSFAVSPYADALSRPGNAPLLDQARRNGHELFLSLPMEPAGSPADTEGTQALSLSINLSQDRKAMFWALSRFPGYVGVTNALGGLRGDRFASASAFSMVADELKRRGLLYVDAGLAPHEQPAIEPPRTRHADLTIDESPDAADIQARLFRLEQLAQSNGGALGIAGPLRPATLERLLSWSRTLHERGITLVPVSALPQPRPAPADMRAMAAFPDRAAPPGRVLSTLAPSMAVPTTVVPTTHVPSTSGPTTSGPTTPAPSASGQPANPVPTPSPASPQ